MKWCALKKWFGLQVQTKENTTLSSKVIHVILEDASHWNLPDASQRNCSLS